MPRPVVRRPRGTEDVLPDAAPRWRRLEGLARALAERHGFGEVRTPTFEHRELVRWSGERPGAAPTYDFLDRGGRALSLRAGSSAPLARACLQGGLLGGAFPVKVFGLMSACRYERPGAGRLREEQRFACESFGAPGPAADAELIVLLAEVLTGAGLDRATVEVGSVGCPDCPSAGASGPEARAGAGWAPPRPDGMADPGAQGGAEAARVGLCAACAEHLAAVRALLAAAGLPHAVHEGRVGGGQRTGRVVFRALHPDGAAPLVLGVGGRHDGVVAALGGAAVPATGFHLGLERVLLAQDRAGVEAPAPPPPDVVVAGEEAAAVLVLCTEARRAGLRADFDPSGRGLAAQLRRAQRLGARQVVVVRGAGQPVSWRDGVTGQRRDWPLEGVVAALRAGRA